MILNDVTYTSEIENLIISNLDGWVIEDPKPKTTSSENEDENKSGGISPFMTTDEMKVKANKVITSTECQAFYEETLDMAYMHTNRLNIDDLNKVETRAFIRAVCKWTASNLWNKYNIRVTNEDLEAQYVPSYGGLLYQSAMKALNPFIVQRIVSMSSIVNAEDNNNDDDWSMI